MKPKPMKPMKAWLVLNRCGKFICVANTRSDAGDSYCPEYGDTIRRVLVTEIVKKGRKR